MQRKNENHAFQFFFSALSKWLSERREGGHWNYTSAILGAKTRQF